MIPFETACTLTPTSDGQFRATITPDWAQGRACFGGLVSALALRSLDGRVPPDRVLRSASLSFAAAVAPGEVVVESAVVRAGKSISHVTAQVLQDGKQCALLQAAYGAPRASGLVVPPPDAPPAPPPDSRDSFPYLEGITPAFTRHFEYRWTTPLPYTGESTRAEIAGWIRHASPVRLDVAAVLAMVDAWPPAVLPLFERPAPASTVTWMVNLAPHDPATPTDGWWFFEAHARRAAEGYADVVGTLRDPAGRLVASSQQLVAEFS